MQHFWSKLPLGAFGQIVHTLLGLTWLYTPWRGSHDCTYFGGASHDEIARKTFRQNTSRGGGTTCLLAWELPVAIGLLFVWRICIIHINGMEWNTCVNQSLFDTHKRKIHFFRSGIAKSFMLLLYFIFIFIYWELRGFIGWGSSTYILYRHCV